MKISPSGELKRVLFCLTISLLLLPAIGIAQEGVKHFRNAQNRVVSVLFVICHKDTQKCDKHIAVMSDDSFITEERLDKKLVANSQGTYKQAYSRYFEKVHGIPTSDLELLSKLEKRKVPDEQVYTIEVQENGQLKKFEIITPKGTNVSRRLMNQFKKIEGLAQAIRTVQNAYDRKAIILNNH